MSKLVSIEPDVRLYLACILTDAMVKAGDTLVVPESLSVSKIRDSEWQQFRLEAAGRDYEAFGILGSHLQ